MPSSNVQDDKEATKRALKVLFDHLKIEKIISIDDNNFSSPSFENFYALCLQLQEKGYHRHVPELETIPFEDADIFAARLENLWNGLTREKGLELYERLYTPFGEIHNQEVLGTEHNDMSILDEILSEHDFEKISLAQWKQKRNDLLERSKTHRTLFLFDQNFKNEGGSDTEGIQNIQNVLISEHIENNALFGLLSHTFISGEEHKLWEKLAKDYEIDKNRFILISKQRLHEAPLGFARMIKLAALNNDCNTLKEQAVQIFKDAHATAAEEINKINIYDFEHIVFQSSASEGVCELDTLFRLFSLFYRAKARDKARLDNDLQSITNKIRSVSAIPTDYNEAPEHSSWKIQQLEFYDEKVNDLHMPIELGDIFEATFGETKKRYILIAQPCDLMVRADGFRQRDVNDAILAEIVSDTGTDGKQKTLHPESHFWLQYFSEDMQSKQTVKYFVNFRKRYSVKLSIIDLCSYSPDGQATIYLENKPPDMMIPPWKKHFYDVLFKQARGITKQYAEIKQTLQQLKEQKWKTILELTEQKLLLLPFITVYKNKEVKERPLFGGRIVSESPGLEYGLRRLKRLSQPHAAALLSKFSRYTAREAFEHDFGKEDNVYSSQNEGHSEVG